MHQETIQDPPQKVGPYRVESLIAIGGMGQVYRAYDERLDRRVALKHVSSYASGYPRVRERFRREARAAARLNHPVIVQIYDVLEEHGGDWIVMELVEGETLARRLREGPLELARALASTRAILAGLAAAHREGIIHRDLKSENVMLTPDERVKILDFGLAKQLWRAESDISLSLEGNLLGTARAMSPEQPLGKEVDQRSDIFSLGTLLYEMLSGRSPFLGPTAVETAIRVCSHRQTPVCEHNPAIPRELSELLDRMLEKEPERRPRSAAEVAASLERIAGRLPAAGFSSAGRSADGLDAEGLDAQLPAAAPGAAPSDARGGRLPADSDPAEPRAARPLPAGLIPTGSQVRSPAAPPPAAAIDGALRERRRLTVLCCDLVGIDRLPQHLDPEIVFEVRQQFRTLVEEEIAPFEGYVVNAVDHRLLVSFGYPRAQEDDARRAIRAGLALVERVEQCSRRGGWARGGALAVRVGIHTGPAVVLRDHPERRERLVLGETLDLAAGIQYQADPNAVLISAAVHQLVKDFFEVQAAEPYQLPAMGRSAAGRPLMVRRVLSACESRSPFAGGPRGAGGRLTPLVARDRELELLLDRWQLAREGAGQVVLLGGEPGIGKSRLVQELEQRAAAGVSGGLAIWGSPYTRHVAFHPIVKLLHRLLAYAPQESPRQRLSKLEAFLRRFGWPLQQIVPRFASLLSLPLDERYPPCEESPSEESAAKEPTAEESADSVREAVLELLLEMAEEQPLFLTVEDLQWIDAATLELLGRLIERSSAASLLLVLTFRPGFEVPWGQPPNLTFLTLSRLTARQVEILAGRVAGGRALPPELRREIVAMTDGVPLFVEELTKSVLESDLLHDGGDAYTLAGPLPPLAIPDTLHASLMARLDRLGSARETARVAAALGREFSHELLAEVSTLDELDLERHLEQLISAELLLRRGFTPRVKYCFKHALIQEAAYASMLRDERRLLHRRIAEVLDGWTSDTAVIPPEELARHHTEAGNAAAAVGSWLQAGKRAIERSAHLEAIEHLERALKLLRTVPDSPERGLQELALLTTLGPVLGNLKGFEGPELEHVYTRAGELCLELGSQPEHFWVLRSISAYFVIRARPRTTLRLAERLLELAGAKGETLLRVESHALVGLSHFLLGELDAAGEHLKRSIALDGDGRERAHRQREGADSGLVSRAVLALVLWHQGRSERAVERSEEAIALARELAHPGTLAETLALAAWLHTLRRDAGAVRRYAEDAIAISEENGILLWLAHGELLADWARPRLARTGPSRRHRSQARRSRPYQEPHVDDFEQRMRQSLDALHADGVIFAQTFLLSLLAESEGGQRNFQRLQEALAVVETSGERFWEPELHRLCGELLAARSGDGARPAEARSHFERALVVAHDQGARALELRAAISLWQLEDGSPAATARLAEVVDGFAAGEGGAELRAARELLEG